MDPPASFDSAIAQSGWNLTLFGFQGGFFLFPPLHKLYRINLMQWREAECCFVGLLITNGNIWGFDKTYEMCGLLVFHTFLWSICVCVLNIE